MSDYYTCCGCNAIVPNHSACLTCFPNHTSDGIKHLAHTKPKTLEDVCDLLSDIINKLDELKETVRYS